MKRYDVQNVTEGPRGVHASGGAGYVLLNAGETRALRLTDKQVASAKATGFLTVTEAEGAAGTDDGGD
jgi:hypothetical protein